MRGLLLCCLAAPLLLGCGAPPPPPSGDAKTKSGDGGHSHERDKMMLRDAGPYHAALTAHLSPKGHELDVFFETADDKPVPVAVPLAKFTAYARRIGEGEPQELHFEPAPEDERPKGEKPGTCSHFVAKAPWLKPTEEYTVSFTLVLGEDRHPVKWTKFVPKKYAHHEE
jgi:hypothetical protein